MNDSESTSILGICAFYHDSAAALLQDGEIMAAAQEERFSRDKHDKTFPNQAIEYCLDYSGLTIDELDAVVFYEKPLRKFERLLETYYEFAPKGLRSFLSAMPVWIKEKLFQKNTIRDGLREVQEFDGDKLNLLFTEHHQSHAGSAFYPSPFENAAILTLDGVGEWATTTVSEGEGNEITIREELHFPHSIGLFYSAFTYFLGFRVNSGEYKMMGLAPYGNPESDRVERFKQIINDELIDRRDDASFTMNMDYFTYPHSLRMVDNGTWEDLFDLEKRVPESDLEQKHCDLAMACQAVTEELVLDLARQAKDVTGQSNLCLAGGVALNCVANGILRREGIFDNIWIQPAAGDAGGALGAAYVINHMYYDRPRNVSNDAQKRIREKEKEKQAVSAGATEDGSQQVSRDSTSETTHSTSPSGKPSVPVNNPQHLITDGMQGSYLGPEYSDLEVEKTARKYDAPFEYYSDFDQLCDDVAGYISEQKVIGWFQGRMEWGPRALGNRSILGDPRNKETQKRINLKIKF
ncbi:MAG: carbamoyltransferase, partial [bacterium]